MLRRFRTLFWSAGFSDYGPGYCIRFGSSESAVLGSALLESDFL